MNKIQFRHNTINWNIVTSSIRGAINTQTQDFIRQFINRREKVIGVVMTDGAGSARFPVDGAYTIAEGIIQNIFWDRISCLDDLFNYSEDEIGNLFYNTSIKLLRKRISELSSNHKNTETIHLSDLSTTMMCFLSDGERYIAISIGDGVIGRCTEDNKTDIIIPPEHLLYVNQTRYITDEDARSHLRIKFGSYDPKSAYILMTDGTCECTYDNRSKVFAPIIHKFCNIVHTYDRKDCSSFIHGKMQELFPKRTNDDCALSIITCKSRLR